MVIDPSAPRARCDSCQKEFFKIELARFGRRKNSPTFCKTCAEAEFARLQRSIEFHVQGKKEIIQ